MAITVVQTKTNTGTTTTLTVTLTATSAGNTLIVTAASNAASAVNPVGNVTATGGTATFGVGLQNEDTNGLVDNEIWWADNIGAGITSVTITWSGANSSYAAVVYEVSGLGNFGVFGSLDKLAQGDNDAGISPAVWTSNTTTTLAQASEIAIGTSAQAGAGVITGPSSPWVNTQVTASGVKIISGTNIVNSTAGLAYAGSSTLTVIDRTATAIATFRAVAAGSPDVPQIQPGPTWLAQFKPGMPRPRPLVPPFFVNKVDTSGSVALPAMATLGNAQASPPPMDLPAINAGLAWLSHFKPGLRPRRPLIIQPPSGPNPANLPNLSDVPQIQPGGAWFGRFKPGLPRPRPVPPAVSGTNNPGSVALPAMGVAGTATVYPTGTGTGILPAMAVSGTVHVPIIISGSAALPAMAASGHLNVPIITSGSVALPAMGIVTPPVNQDQRHTKAGPTFSALFKKQQAKRALMIPGGPQYIGSPSASAALPAMGVAGQIIQYLPFPQFPLNLKFELLINGTWLDITTFVYQRNDIVITRGLPDETQSVTPSQMTCTLDNRDGRFSPNNPLGAYFPYLTRNTQLRCSVVNQASADGNPYSGYRFWGEVSSFPPRWDPSGSDVSCDIIVSGVLRRYVQAAPLGSTLRQYYTSLSGNFTPGAYWPCEDGGQASELASALPSVAAMTFTGSPGFASDSSFGGSDALPTIGSSVWHGVTSAAANPPGTGTITQRFPGTYHFTAPPGVTAVTGVQCTGSGGGGGDQNTTIGGGGGGGGGVGKGASVSVTPGSPYTYVVPPGGSTTAGGSGGDGADATFTGDSQTVTGKGAKGGAFGGVGGNGGAGPTFNGGKGGTGSTGFGGTFSSSVVGNSGAGAGGANGSANVGGWTAPQGVTGVNVTRAIGAGAGGQGGGAFADGHGGGAGGGGGSSSGSVAVTPGQRYSPQAGNGGGGGGSSGQGGGHGGVSSFPGDDGTISGGGGSGGGGAGGGGSGGSGDSSGGGGGNGSAKGATAMGAGGGGGGGGGGHGGNASGRTPGNGSGTGAGGGWGATSSNGSGATTGGTGASYGGGGGGGGAIANGSGAFGGGGGPGIVSWQWTVPNTPTGGGGGSSAGTSGAGSTGATGGTGGSAPSGGGAGGTTGATPAGSSPGGGGAGGVPAAADGSSEATTPGAGGPGQVSFSWSGGTTSPVAADIVRFCLHVDSAGAADGAILAQILTYGTIATINVVYHTGGKLELLGYNASSVQVLDSGQIAFSADGTPLYISVEITGVGANATWTLAGIRPGATSLAASASGSVTGASVGNVSDVFVDPAGTVVDSGTALGQITVQTYADTLVNLSPIVAGFAGETAAARISRLCLSQGIGFELTGNASDTPLMGPQQDDTFVNILQSCADLDRGQLSETRDQLGIGYRTRVSMQGQSPDIAADYSAATLSGALAPVADDQFTRNYITATRNGGASSVAQLSTGTMSILTPPNGVGVYSYSVTVQGNNDGQLANLAAWILSVGTVAEYRYPAIEFDLARAEVEDLFSQIPALDIGDFVQVVNPPSFLQSDPISQLCWGFTEVLNAYTWTISINTVPESPYSAGNPPTW